MAKAVKQQISAVLTAAVERELRNARPKIRKGVKSMANAAVDLMRDRTELGIDVDGKRLPPLTILYRKAKLSMIRGKRKFPKGAKTKWRAKSVPGHGRLTGLLFSSFKSTVSQAALFGTKIVISFRLTSVRKVGSYNLIDVLKGTKARGGKTKASRNIFGLAKARSNRGKKERRILLKAFERGSGIKISNIVFK